MYHDSCHTNNTTTMMVQPPEISTADLAARQEDPEAAVIDVRPVAAYNGWRLREESRGGHIPGATNLPMRWQMETDLARILRERGIFPDQSLILYGYDEGTVERMAEQLSRSEFEHLSVYTAFIDEWVPDTSRPLESLDRYQQLVYPEWIHRLTEGGDPLSGPEGEHVLCHVHADEREDYKTGHIPDAIPLDTRRLEAPGDWNRRSPEELRTALLSHGIRHDTTVILYGRPAALKKVDSGGYTIPGQMGAMRCATILLYAGVEDVRILNGGLAAWKADGFDLSTERTRTESVDSFGKDIPARPELFIDTPEAQTWLADENSDLVSVRSYDELDGTTSGYDYITQRGWIPEAISAPSGSDVHHVEEYRNPDQTMRPSREVAETWTEHGVDPDSRIAFYCGTGWRASEAFMHAYLMNWTDIAVYDGGWYEWSSDRE